ncbi:30S ribosomal protein S18 [Rickettsiales bacterium]|nr:30S ribosomal protein S18 [Rickettsiales bacterium]
MDEKNKLFDNNRNITSKKCPLSGKYAPIIDYKNIDLLKRYTTEKGKILPSRVTQVCTKKQRNLALAVKRARFLALLPYVSN